MCLDVLSARLKRRCDWRCLFWVAALAHAVRTSAAGNRYLCVGFRLRAFLEGSLGGVLSRIPREGSPLQMLHPGYRCCVQEIRAHGIPGWSNYST